MTVLYIAGPGCCSDLAAASPSAKEAKPKEEVVATIDRFLAEVPQEQAKVFLKRQVMAQLAASALSASGELPEAPQVDYSATLPIASPDRTNAHTAPQAPSGSSGAESSVPVFSPDAPGPAEQVIADQIIGLPFNTSQC